MSSARRFVELLDFMCCCNKRSANHIKLTSELARAYREVAYNLLYTEVSLTEAERKSLQKIKKVLRLIAKPNISLNKLRKLLTRRVVRLLLKPALRILNGAEVYPSSDELVDTAAASFAE